MIEDVQVWGDQNYTAVSFSIDRKNSKTVVNLNITLTKTLNTLKVNLFLL